MKEYSKYLIIGVAFFIVSFAISVQLRITSSADSEVSQEKIITKLKDEIFQLNDDKDKLNKKLVSTETKLEQIRSKAAENDTSNTEKNNLIKKYTIIQGITEAKGTGVVIRYFPNEKNQYGEDVTNIDIAKDLIDIVNELRNAGAEAIAVNDIRFVNESSIEVEKNNIVIDSERIARPYVIKAIGNSATMNSSLIRPGGTIELIKKDRAKIELVITKEVKVPKCKNL